MRSSEKTLSLCLIVKNEERNLLRCLASARVICNEVVVVDTGSTDDTVAVADGFGSRVFDCSIYPFDFSKARNFSLSKATGDWILVLDADETLRYESFPLIDKILGDDQNTGYACTRFNHGGYTAWSDYVVRLFPNRSEYHFRGRVHETIDRSILDSGGKLMRSNVEIDHWDFGDQRLRKNSWYMEMLNDELAEDPTNCQRLAFLASGYHQIGDIQRAGEVAERIAELMPDSDEAQTKAQYYRNLNANKPSKTC